jgi:hypothetical protein
MAAYHGIVNRFISIFNVLMCAYIHTFRVLSIHSEAGKKKNIFVFFESLISLSSVSIQPLMSRNVSSSKNKIHFTISNSVISFYFIYLYFFLRIN